MNQKKVIIFLIGFILLTTFASNSYSSDRYKERLEKLFLWKASDELNLNPTEEAAFTQTIRELNDSKNQASEDLRLTIDKMQNTADEKKLDDLIRDYQNHLKKINDNQNKETESLKKLLGTRKFAKYLIIKEQFTQKLKSLLSNQPTDQKSTPKTDPKVIEN